MIRLLFVILALSLAPVLAPGQQELYYDQFDWGVATGEPGDLNTGFWNGQRAWMDYQPFLPLAPNEGAVRLSGNGGVSFVESLPLPVPDYEFHARIRLTNFDDSPGERNAEIAFRTNGNDGYMITLDGGQDLVRLRRQGGGFTDLVPPANVPIVPGDDFYLRVAVEGDGPVRIRTWVSRSTDLTTPSLVYSVDHMESEWIQNGDRARMIGYTPGTSYFYDFDYLSIGELGYDHPAEHWNRVHFPDAPPEPEVIRVGDLDGWESTPGSVTLHSGDARIRLLACVPGALRVDFAPAGDFSWFGQSYAVTDADWLTTGVTVSDVPDAPLAIAGPGWCVDVERTPLRLVFHDASGRPLFGETPGSPMLAASDQRSLSLTLDAGESIYGLGQNSIYRGIGLDRRGHAFPIDNEHQPPSRLLFPYWVSSKGYGVFLDNPAEAAIDIGASDPDALTYTTPNGGELRYYVYAGKSMDEALELHAQITGRPALAPRWTLGNIQSKYGYESFDQIQAIIDGFRNRSIPLDAIIIDLYWFGIETMGNLEFQNTPQWANPVERLAGFRSQGIKTIPITEPQVTGLSFNQPELEAQGLLGEHPGGGAYGFPLSWVTGQALTYLIDFTDPDARAWWAEKHERLIVDYGFAGFWQDLNEPEAQPDDIVYEGGTGVQAGNAIAINMNRALHEAMAEYRPGARTFIMSRSGYPGMQRYGASVWSGDVASSWYDLERQPAVALGMGMAGVPNWNSDIGGFNGNPSPELYVRWCQFGLFNPTYRPHAAHSDREPWRFGSEAENIVGDVIRLRYRLIPHYYGVSRESYDTGAPIMRPLVLEFPGDTAVRDISLPWLYGRDLLCRPVVEQGAQSVDVYFPSGRWRHFLSGEIFEGPSWINRPTPLDALLFYQREGSIIPLGPVVQTSDASPLETVELKIFPDSDGNAEGELYEDDGLTLGYQENAFSRTFFSTVRLGGTTRLLIDAVRGGFPELVEALAWELELAAGDTPLRVVADGESLPQLSTAQYQAATEGWRYDAAAQNVRIKLSRGAVTTARTVDVVFEESASPGDIWMAY